MRPKEVMKGATMRLEVTMGKGKQVRSNKDASKGRGEDKIAVRD